jgi:hypothetical protein
VRVAVVDANGDGRLDIVTGQGLDGQAIVLVYDGLTLRELDAYDVTFHRGIFAAAG